MEKFRKTLTRAAGPVGVIGAVGGFIGDIIAPLGNFAPWLAGLSLVLALLALAGFLTQRRKQGTGAWDSPMAGGLLITGASTVIFGLWGVVFAAGPETGYLADNLAPIATVQAQLLNLQEDVSEIKNTTGETATQVAVAATAQAEGFADIQAAFAALQAGGGNLVSDPQTPQEWYSNARLYQLRGDTANALKAYEGYFTFPLEYVDPYLDYTAMLKASEGIARTRQIIGEQLAARPDSLALELTLARLLDTPEERLARLEALTTRAPQFGPAFFELGQEYDRALIGGSFTADLLEKQSNAYTTLFKLEEQQAFTRYYIDKPLADEHLELARKMLAAYEASGEALSQIDIQIYNYAHGVQFAILSAAVSSAKDLFFSIDNPQPSINTGKVGGGAQTFVNVSIGPLVVSVGDHTLYLQYIDQNDVPSEVFSKAFRIDPIALTFFQQPPDFSTNTIPGNFTVGVVGLTSSELYTFHYSIDNDSLSEKFESVSSTALSVTGLTAGEHTLYIQGTPETGDPTPVVQFQFVVK